MEYLIGWVVFSVASASVAKGKNRRVALWAVVGILLGPFAILIVALLPPAAPREEGAEESPYN